MEVRIRNGRNHEVEAFARFHRVVCDRTFDEGGNDSGMTPPELMLSAIGCCAMTYAGEYLRTRNLEPCGVEIRVTAEIGAHPARLVEIGIEVDAPGLAIRTRKGLLKAVEACLLHRTLTNPPRVKVTMATEVIEGPPAVESANVV